MTIMKQNAEGSWETTPLDKLEGIKERKDTISRALGVQIMVRKRCNHEGCVTQTHIVKVGVCVSHIVWCSA